MKKSTNTDQLVSETVDQSLQTYDEDNDGYINYGEFYRYMLTHLRMGLIFNNTNKISQKYLLNQLLFLYRTHIRLTQDMKNKDDKES